MADDPIAQYLRSLNISDAVRAQAWEAAYSDDDTTAEAQLRKLPKYLSPKVLETLWDPRSGAPLPADTKPYETARPEDFTAKGPEGSALSRFTSNAGAALNPVTMVTGLYKAVESPEAVGRTLENIYGASAAQAAKAAEAYRQGRYLEMAGHGAAMFPVIGPAAAESGEQIASGDIAGGTGKAVGLIGSILAPSAITKAASSVPIVPRVGARVPAPVREAVQFGLREGVPVDVATATGNRFLRGTQRIAEESLLGSRIGETARAAQAEALTATGQRLAGRASPTAVTAEQAGQAARDAVTRRAASYQTAADTAYDKLRAIEAQQAARIQQTGGIQGPATAARPFTAVPLAVDIAPTKAAMQPIYQALADENAIVPFMSGSQKGKALVALERLMKAPDQAPLSIADGALGELKDLARVDQTFRRTVGQGIAAEAVTNLDKAVRATAQQAGPDALRALMDGRAATVNKFKTIELLDTLAKEPVGVFNQATWAKDAGLARLRNLARVAPNEVRQIGRAWIENALTKATAEGGFGRAQGLLADWHNLGPQTKQLLFRDAAHVKDLDNFFLLAKKLAENPNPSGTALTVLKGAELSKLGQEIMMGAPGLGVGYTLSAPVVAKLLLSPRTTRLLLQGLRIPVSAKAARTAWAGELGRLLQDQAPAMVPAVAGAPAAVAPGATAAPEAPR